MSDEPAKGKIHIDSDWKAEAAETKERLAAEEQKEHAAPRGPLPDPTLGDLINMIAMPAAMSIAGYRTPDGQEVPPDLAAAKYHIDMLSLVEEKTKGNVSDEESRLLAGLLHQLRMQYTESAMRAGRPGGAAPDSGDQ